VKLVPLVGDRPQNKNLLRGGPGRRKGSTNQFSKDVKAFAEGLFKSPEYVKSLTKRILEGRAPHMEVLLYHYLFGKPKETVEHSVSPDLVHMLGERLRAAKQKAREAHELPESSHGFTVVPAPLPFPRNGAGSEEVSE
jgi:mRNA-degrading endonuclease YafQ of YafQ-DinJ toxin-antitoxin module